MFPLSLTSHRRQTLRVAHRAGAICGAGAHVGSPTPGRAKPCEALRFKAAGPAVITITE